MSTFPAIGSQFAFVGVVVAQSQNGDLRLTPKTVSLSVTGGGAD